MAVIPYLTARTGANTTYPVYASRMNTLFEEADRKLSLIANNQSIYFLRDTGTDGNPGYIQRQTGWTGPRFYFYNGTPKYIRWIFGTVADLDGDAFPYDHLAFTDAVAGTAFYKPGILEDSTANIRIIEAPAVGYWTQANRAQDGNALLNWSLEAHQKDGWNICETTGHPFQAQLPVKFAQVELIFENVTTFAFPLNYNHYNFFRIHNFGPGILTVTFPGGAGVVVPALGSKCVRRASATSGYVIGWNHFQKFVAGDPRYWDRDFANDSFVGVAGMSASGGIDGRVTASAYKSNNVCNPSLLATMILSLATGLPTEPKAPQAFFDESLLWDLVDDYSTDPSPPEEVTSSSWLPHIAIPPVPLDRRYYGNPDGDTEILANLLYHRGVIESVKIPIVSGANDGPNTTREEVTMERFTDTDIASALAAVGASVALDGGGNLQISGASNVNHDLISKTCNLLSLHGNGRLVVPLGANTTPQTGQVYQSGSDILVRGTVAGEPLVVAGITIPKFVPPDCDPSTHYHSLAEDVFTVGNNSDSFSVKSLVRFVGYGLPGGLSVFTRTVKQIEKLDGFSPATPYSRVQNGELYLTGCGPILQFEEELIMTYPPNDIGSRIIYAGEADRRNSIDAGMLTHRSYYFGENYGFMWLNHYHAATATAPNNWTSARSHQQFSKRDASFNGWLWPMLDLFVTESDLSQEQLDGLKNNLRKPQGVRSSGRQSTFVDESFEAGNWEELSPIALAGPKRTAINGLSDWLAGRGNEFGADTTAPEWYLTNRGRLIGETRNYRIPASYGAATKGDASDGGAWGYDEFGEPVETRMDGVHGLFMTFDQFNYLAGLVNATIKVRPLNFMWFFGVTQIDLTGGGFLTPSGPIFDIDHVRHAKDALVEVVGDGASFRETSGRLFWQWLGVSIKTIEDVPIKDRGSFVGMDQTPTGRRSRFFGDVLAVGLPESFPPVPGPPPAQDVITPGTLQFANAETEHEEQVGPIISLNDQYEFIHVGDVAIWCAANGWRLFHFEVSSPTLCEIEDLPVPIPPTQTTPIEAVWQFAFDDFQVNQYAFTLQPDCVDVVNPMVSGWFVSRFVGETQDTSSPEFLYWKRAAYVTLHPGQDGVVVYAITAPWDTQGWRSYKVTATGPYVTLLADWKYLEWTGAEWEEQDSGPASTTATLTDGEFVVRMPWTPSAHLMGGLGGWSLESSQGGGLDENDGVPIHSFASLPGLQPPTTALQVDAYGCSVTVIKHERPRITWPDGWAFDSAENQAEFDATGPNAAPPAIEEAADPPGVETESHAAGRFYVTSDSAHDVTFFVDDLVSAL